MSISRGFVVNADDAAERLDTLLGERNLYASRSAAAKAIEAGKVLVNGNAASKSTRLKEGDAIVCEIDEPTMPHVLTGEAISLDIRYEDDDLIVLSKQAGLVCHPSVDHLDGTLVNALIYHCGADHLCNVQGDDDRLGIVHRLDMDTTGLMLAAKNDETGYALMDAIREKTIERRYLALAHGIIPHDTGIIDAPIARAPKDRTRMAVRDCDSARDAITTFRVLKRYEAESHDDGYTLLDCKLFTGRTHQIRVHMEYARHPLVGDPLYTAHAPHYETANLGLRRQFLHSFLLQFEHPITGEELSFTDNVPSDLAHVLDSLAERERETTEAGREIAELLSTAPHPSVEALY